MKRISKKSKVCRAAPNFGVGRTMKVACRGLEGDGWNRSKQLTPRQPSTLLFQDLKTRGGVPQTVPDL